jgi:WD40 repeat protein
MWKAATGRLYAGCKLEHLDDPHARVALFPGGRLLAAVSSDGTVKVWEAATGRMAAECSGHRGWVHGVAFSADGRFLASAANDGSVKMWEAATGRVVADCTECTGAVTSMAFSPDGRFVAWASEDGTVKVWDVRRSSGQIDPCIATLLYESIPKNIVFTVSGGVLRLLVGDKRGRAFGYEVLSR